VEITSCNGNTGIKELLNEIFDIQMIKQSFTVLYMGRMETEVKK
jgi:hypothetical protein